MKHKISKKKYTLEKPRRNTYRDDYKKRRKTEKDFTAEPLEATECKALWKAVLNRVLLDLKWGYKPTVYQYYQESYRGSKGKKAVYKQKIIDDETINAFRAKAFLSIDNPDFLEVCRLADVDPAYVTEHLVGVGMPTAKYGRSAHSRVSIFDKNITIKDIYADLAKESERNQNPNFE